MVLEDILLEMLVDVSDDFFDLLSHPFELFIHHLSWPANVERDLSGSGTTAVNKDMHRHKEVLSGTSVQDDTVGFVLHGIDIALDLDPLELGLHDADGSIDGRNLTDDQTR